MVVIQLFRRRRRSALSLPLYISTDVVPLGDIVISLGSSCFSRPVRAVKTGARTDLMEVPLPRNPAIVQRKAGNIHQRNFFRDESSEVTTTGRAEETKYKKIT